MKLREKIKDDLKKLDVGVLYLIGSRATEKARKNSDYDFAVVMKNSENIKKREKGLYEKLYSILEKTIPKRRVNLPYPGNMVNIDIIFLETAPLYYAIAARDEGKVLFQVSSEFRMNFEEKITIQYGDMEYFRKEQEKATLEMI